uniref:UPAR/Ly6 domain-containing protein n=1 Tax=Oryctolagus cuniculus TaxID=9986 RepID=U3KNN4_RABIT
MSSLDQGVGWGPGQSRGLHSFSSNSLKSSLHCFLPQNGRCGRALEEWKGRGGEGGDRAPADTGPAVCGSDRSSPGVRFRAGKVQQSSQEKGCSSNTCTPLAFSATLGNERTFGYDLQCCSSELCNQKDVFGALSQKSPDPNGVKCPACYSEESVFCGTTDLPCTGRETKCVEVVATGMSTPWAAMYGMGCATENACNLKGQQVLSGIKIWTRCIDPSSGGPALLSATSSMLSSLFLLKVFL